MDNILLIGFLVCGFWAIYSHNRKMAEFEKRLRQLEGRE